MAVAHRSLRTGVVIFVSCASSAWAQDPVPPFQNLRFEEDWSQYPPHGSDSIFDLAGAGFEPSTFGL